MNHDVAERFASYPANVRMKMERLRSLIFAVAAQDGRVGESEETLKWGEPAYLKGEWHKAAKILSDAARKIETAGADFLMICANTMHKVAEEVQAEISIPLLHIADVTAEALVANGVTKVGLLGTQFTMGEDFYKSRVSEKYAIEVIVPEKPQQEIVHNIIYSELIMGEINDESSQQYLEIIDQLHAQGAQAVILGCTEIALLVQQNHTKIPLYDTTEIHAAQAVKLALSE